MHYSSPKRSAVVVRSSMLNYSYELSMNNTRHTVSKKCDIFYNSNNFVCIIHKYDLTIYRKRR